MRWAWAVLLVSSVALTGVFSGCKKAEPAPRTAVEYARNAKRDYDKAIDAYFSQDWEEALELFGQVKQRYGYSRYARLAELRVADTQYRQREYAEAVTSYRSFIHDYPNDPLVAYARYKVTKALFEETRPSLLLAPLEERDLADVIDAHRSIREFLNDYPDHQQQPEIEYMREAVAGLLARHELYVARFYLKERRYEATIARVEHSLKEFEGSGLEAEALVLLGETYLRTEDPSKARAAFSRVIRDYPSSPFVLTARRFLQHM